MDKLSKLLKTQKELNDWIRKERNLPEQTTEEQILQWTRCITHEAIELEDAFNWKHWKNRKDIDWLNVKEEAIDILHFLLSIFTDLGMTSDDVYNAYMDKNKENINRQLGKSEREGYKLDNIKKANA